MDNNFFTQLQAMSSLGKETSVSQTRKQLNLIVETFKSQPDYEDTVSIMAENVRNLKTKTLLDCDSFMLEPDTPVTLLPEELRHDALGFCKQDRYVFEGRYIYPVKDVHSDVMGFLAYDKFEDAKYLDSKNHGYVAKRYSMWGMERIKEYYTSTEPVYIVEGVVCALYLRQEGCQALATLGSIWSPYVYEIVKRFGTRAIVINDADDAGSACKAAVKRRLPYVRCVQSKIAKDVDDSRDVDANFIVELRKLRNPYYMSPLFK